MKLAPTLLLALVAFVAAPAHAIKLNDYVIYNQTQMNNGAPITFQVKTEATTVDATNVTFTQTATYNGAVIQTATQATTVAQVEANENAFSLCSSYGGTLEDVVVPYGTVSSCHVSSGGANTWVAAGIPIGIVKQTSGADDTTVSVELVSFLKN
jgi:hypothetical protein